MGQASGAPRRTRPCVSDLRAPAEIVVVGADALGIEVCRSLASAARHVHAVWPKDAPSVDELAHVAVALTTGDASRPSVLAQAGVGGAKTILAVGNDDQFNLQVALAARDLNPDIRIVLRQFNRRLAQKIVSQLPNCEAVSPETHSAATYAASCVNRCVYQALEFPRYSEDLVVFCAGSGQEFGVAGATVGDVTHRRGWHVLAVDETRFPAPTVPIPGRSNVTIACRIEAAPPVAPLETTVGGDAGQVFPERRRRSVGHALRSLRIDPIFAGLLIAMAALVTSATSYFHAAGLTWVNALYHVANSVTTTGREAQTLPFSPQTRLVEIAVDLGSVAIVGMLLAYVTAAITSRSIEIAQGRHQVRASGHVIVCGFGNVGSRVARYLLNLGRKVVVIDRSPDAANADAARARGAHVMTADATTEDALEMASVRHAAALLAVTDSDSANLEVALTAVASAPKLPVIMRIAEHATAKSVERHFRIRASYSAAALAVPLITGLAFERGSRGTVEIAGKAFELLQRPRRRGPAPDEIVLVADADNELVLVTG